MCPLGWGPIMTTQELSFLENEGTYENSYYERPSMNLFGQVADSQGDTAILHETDPTHDDVSHDGKRQDMKDLAGATSPKKNAQEEHGRRGKEGTPKLGQFGTFTVGQGACAVLDIDAPVVNDDALRNYPKGKLGRRI